MQIETPPSEKPYEKPEGERRGLLLVNTGDGKGKSTAAFGLALRAHGRGKRVKIYQFMKVPTARFGEHRMFEQLGIPIEGLGDGFSWKSQDLERSAQLARDGWQKARAAILSGEPVKDDDGEAGAGALILQMLDRAGLRDHVVIVTRWYGGKQLGGDRFRHVADAVRLYLRETGLG